MFSDYFKFSEEVFGIDRTFVVYVCVESRQTPFLVFSHPSFHVHVFMCFQTISRFQWTLSGLIVSCCYIYMR
jgi:hypothetical protein